MNQNNFVNASAIGAYSRVDANDALVLGSVAGINGATSTVYVGIGTTNPQDRLHVAGNIRMVDGNQASGKILRCDALGTGYWQNVNATDVSAWGLTGNAGTVDALNFLGTTDGVPLNFRVNNQRAGKIGVTGQVFWATKRVMRAHPLLQQRLAIRHYIPVQPVLIPPSDIYQCTQPMVEAKTPR